jgi:hypothetical protein
MTYSLAFKHLLSFHTSMLHFAAAALWWAGNAVAKSGRPRGKAHLTTSLKALLQLATNPQQEQKPQQ